MNKKLFRQSLAQVFRAWESLVVMTEIRLLHL